MLVSEPPSEKRKGKKGVWGERCSRQEWEKKERKPTQFNNPIWPIAVAFYFGFFCVRKCNKPALIYGPYPLGKYESQMHTLETLLKNIISQVLCEALQPSSCKSSMSLLEPSPKYLHLNNLWHLSIKFSLLLNISKCNI